MKYSNSVKSALAIAVLGFLALGLVSTPALAATSVTTTFQVTATVVASCSISGTTIAFGNYSGAVLTQSGTLTITCNAASTPYNIGLNQGTFGTAPYARQMGNGAARLNYGLYQNAGLTTNWGTTIGTDTQVGTSSATAMTPTTTTVYGQIPAGQVVTTGAYTDTITATITY